MKTPLERELDRIEARFGKGAINGDDRRAYVEPYRLVDRGGRLCVESPAEYFARHGGQLFIPSIPYKGNDHA